jgi:hypothetical protein
VALRGLRIGVLKAARERDGPRAANREHAARGFGRGKGDPLRQALVRTIVVEVLDILAEDAPQVGLAQDEEAIRAFCRGAQYAVRSTVMPVDATTREKAAPYLLSLSRIR